MTENATVRSSSFALTFANALAVFKHVWQQLDALESRLDQELPDEFKKMQWIIEGTDEDERKDELDNVVERMWQYDIKKKAQGSPKLARLFCRYLLVPVDGAEDGSFTPYFSCTVVHKSEGDYGMGDLEYLEDCRSGHDGCEPLILGTHIEGCLGAFIWPSNEKAFARVTAMYLPIECINSSSLTKEVIPGILELTKRCVGVAG